MLIDGIRCPVLGRITMDQTIVDVSEVENIELGMDVVVLGCQKEECITADELADHCDTISYEIICNFGNGLMKKYIDYTNSIRKR